MQCFVISRGVKHFAFSFVSVISGQALEVVPYTLAENAGLNPINIVTELRKAHANGQVV